MFQISIYVQFHPAITWPFSVFTQALTMCEGASGPLSRVVLSIEAAEG